MEHTWTAQLLGCSVESVERWEAQPCVVKLSGGYRIQVEALWRLLEDGTLALTSQDDGQSYGCKQPVDAISGLSRRIVGRSVVSVTVTPGTADLTVGFGHELLQVISTSSGYEAWQVEGPQSTVAVGQGGGNVAVWG